jgi:hypothetical protein
MRRPRIQVISISLLLLLCAGCKQADSGNAGPSAVPVATPTPASGQPPVAPASPPPSFSAAQKLGMFAYPKNKQGSDQQLRDEYDCYTQVQQQTGINAEAPPPSAPSAAEVQAAQQQAAANAPEAQGGRARGAAKGAAGGAVIGGIAGDAGTGAAIGAVAGTVRGGRKQREANASSKQQASQSASAQMQQQYAQAKAAYSKQMDTFKRGFSACMDARGYSVK